MASALKISLGLQPYFAVYPSSRPNTDTVLKDQVRANGLYASLVTPDHVVGADPGEISAHLPSTRRPAGLIGPTTLWTAGRLVSGGGDQERAAKYGVVQYLKGLDNEFIHSFWIKMWSTPSSISQCSDWVSNLYRRWLPGLAHETLTMSTHIVSIEETEKMEISQKWQPENPNSTSFWYC